MFHDSYLVMKVNYGSKNRNEEFLKQFPKVPAYPHYFVLDTDGGFLKSQGTGELEKGKGYNRQVFLGFLNKYRLVAKRDTKFKSNAEVVLAKALQQARAEKKKVLIHLGAPT